MSQMCLLWVEHLISQNRLMWYYYYINIVFYFSNVCGHLYRKKKKERKKRKKKRKKRRKRRRKKNQREKERKKRKKRKKKERKKERERKEKKKERKKEEYTVYCLCIAMYYVLFYYNVFFYILEWEKLGQCTYCICIVCKTLLLLLRCNVRDGFGGIGRFKGKSIKLLI